MNSRNEACQNPSDVDHLIERLEQSPADERISAIEKLSDIGADTRTFLREHFEATEVAVLNRENLELTEERDRLKNDFDILQTISQDIEAMSKAVGRGQRRIRESQVTQAGLQEQLVKSFGPLTERLAGMESRLDRAVSQAQIDSINDDLKILQSRLVAMGSLKDGLGQVQQKLHGLARAKDLEPLLREMRELKSRLDELQANQPKPVTPQPYPPPATPK